MRPFRGWVGSFLSRLIRITPISTCLRYSAQKRLNLTIRTQPPWRSTKPKRGCTLYKKLRSIHHFNGLNKGCVQCIGASYTHKITVVKHMLTSLLSKYFLHKETALHIMVQYHSISHVLPLWLLYSIVTCWKCIVNIICQVTTCPGGWNVSWTGHSCR